MTYRPKFPVLLRPAVSALLRALPFAELACAKDGFTVLFQGEQLSIPYRIYCASHNLRSVIADASGDTRILALCIGTRHWDGYVREECLRQLIGTDRTWVVPFVVQLLGEYVVEIAEVISAALPEVDTAQFSAFARENPNFMAITRQRVTSYWDCYYRARFQTLQAYPAFIALEAIEKMALTT
ncbi:MULTISPECIES: hypothetical protein [Variovorax]|jgi:hypothetical protein|uniref:hypothetical protein n=1 Tax=Variovorax TaxID=34072 RepID=UPI00086AD136|nr:MULTISPECIES: hypothetical protein [Variovorax]MBN8754699.1 hypothetical protein [Variovorax sp.]ODU19412.1 MAG: hypothetical protein ABS94_00735 [Variovorax sp. SCN 67-85]ODV25313.1 MAG: hypothetical protein ABT25_11075 [Variovorax sp. SCN 67-20]OJZ03132.1 MAG: hypothetical protein BGP22_00730 [Variovorax sp. 67-131]UKI08220.1 hypothetical protein L3V85_36505 [Variovorax paradoxus]